MPITLPEKFWIITQECKSHLKIFTPLKNAERTDSFFSLPAVSLHFAGKACSISGRYVRPSLTLIPPLRYGTPPAGLPALTEGLFFLYKLFHQQTCSIIMQILLLPEKSCCPQSNVLIYSAPMNICLFTREEIEKPLPWNDERSQHLIKILHKKQGDSFAAGIIEGQAGKALITKITEKSSIEFSFEPESSGKTLYPLNMIIGFPRPIQLKRLLRDISGLGAKAVYLTGTELGEKSYLQSTLVERGAAYQMLLDGTVQAGSTHVPNLFIHKNLAECIEAASDAESAEKTTRQIQDPSVPVLKIALDNINPQCSLKDFIEAGISQSASNNLPYLFKATAAIGSERGWTDKERAFLEKSGFTRCSMGSRILRTESAATVAASIILNYMGVLN